VLIGGTTVSLSHARRRDGKGYVCYPYDSNYPDGWSFDIELDGSTEYKGLKLTIHANCMVEVRNWEKETI